MALTRRGALGSAGALAAAWATGARADEVYRAEVPFNLRDDQPLTAVRINGQGPFTFLIDTGATGICLKRSIGARLRLPVVAEARAQGAVGRTGTVPVFQAEDVFVAGGLSEPHSYIFASDALEGSRVDGLFPFAGNVTELGMDFDRQRFILDRRPPDSRDGFDRIAAEMRQPSGVRGGMQSYVDPRARVAVTFDGRPANLLVDTGAQGGLFLKPDFVSAQNLWDHYPRRQDTANMGMAGPFRTRFVIAEEFRIGRFRFQAPPVTLGHPDDSGRDGWGGADGLIGMEILRRMNFFLRPRDDSMWLKASGHIGDTWRFDRSGLDLRWANERVEVVTVRSGSSADAAGLREGDVIVASSAGGGAYEALVWALKDEPGTVIRMAVERDGSRRELELTLGNGFDTPAS